MKCEKLLVRGKGLNNIIFRLFLCSVLRLQNHMERNETVGLNYKRKWPLQNKRNSNTDKELKLII